MDQDRYYRAFENALAAYRASKGPDVHFAAMVGSLKVLIAYDCDAASLERITLDLERRAQEELVTVLGHVEAVDA